jgi:glycosyltransferase involved in cell wall biosynthesis
MVTRRKIGLIYHYNENWIGGTYYIQNLIAALSKLPVERQFELVIFASDEEQFNDLSAVTKYPFLTKGSYVITLPIVKRILNRIGRVFSNENIFSVFNKDIALVFPADNEHNFKPDQTFLYWIPDFQEHYLPAFFTPEEVSKRKKAQAEIVTKGTHIVFSSQSAKNDFNEIYPSNKLIQFMLQFAVTHPVLKADSSLTDKYHLPGRYFICSNQFWKHKNHIVVIKAIHLLKQQGHEVCVVLTGKEHDYRNPDFFSELTSLVETLEIEDNVRFLGFISREDQLGLMKNAVAVIQPSLFEGWSTVIEDAKALQVKIIASKINVHQEQLQRYDLAVLFSPDDFQGLAASVLKIEEIKGGGPCYDESIKLFAENFENIFNNITSK